MGGEPDAGRHLAAWATEAGFSDVAVSSSSWTYATPEDRAWWGSLWADRVRASTFAETALTSGLSDHEELEELAAAWRAFGAVPEGRFVVPHGEILCRVS